ncbi:MAG: TetR/AcrR family transcriptional regulator [Alphaproteobacteria bacterium]|nr:TetR/AcrR family transcriptional regulator [Alphaproteobacteria bacterium]
MADDDRTAALLDTALALAAERGWYALALADIAGAAGVSLAELYRVFASKTAILAALVSHTDRAVLAMAPGELAAEPPRDRLFDILMRRFDVLAPHKPALAAVFRDGPRDPLAMLGLAPHLLKSMAWMLAAAGLSAHGLAGALRIKVLAAIYLVTVRTWLADESLDMARTMAALDARLRRAGRLFEG